MDTYTSKLAKSCMASLEKFWKINVYFIELTNWVDDLSYNDYTNASGLYYLVILRFFTLNNKIFH